MNDGRKNPDIGRTLAPDDLDPPDPYEMPPQAPNPAETLVENAEELHQALRERARSRAKGSTVTGPPPNLPNRSRGEAANSDDVQQLLHVVRGQNRLLTMAVVLLAVICVTSVTTLVMQYLSTLP